MIFSLIFFSYYSVDYFWDRTAMQIKKEVVPDITSMFQEYKKYIVFLFFEVFDGFSIQILVYPHALYRPVKCVFQNSSHKLRIEREAFDKLCLFSFMYCSFASLLQLSIPLTCVIGTSSGAQTVAVSPRPGSVMVSQTVRTDRTREYCVVSRTMLWAVEVLKYIPGASHFFCKIIFEALDYSL